MGGSRLLHGETSAFLYGKDMTALTNYTIDQISNYLTTGFWDHELVFYNSFNVSGSGVGANGRTLVYNYSGFSNVEGAGTDFDGLTGDRRALVDTALDYLGTILNINFVESASQSDDVDLYFMDNDLGAYANMNFHGSGNGATDHRYTDYAWINIEPGWSGGSSDIGGYTYQTILHEVLHTLGLGHSGPYNYDGSPTYETLYVTDSDQALANRSNIYLNDSWQQTIMSYFDQDENTSVDADFGYTLTPMAADLRALQSYYSNSAFFSNTTYGFNTNIKSEDSEVLARLSEFADTMAFCIFDSGGNDTLDFSGFSADQTIDLTVADGASTTGTISDIGGMRGNMTLSVGTVIENAVGGAGNDTITGNDSNNTLTGNDGNDRFLGKGGADRIEGGNGTDTVVYDGVRADYVQDLQVDGSILLTKSDGSLDLLLGIERLDLIDGDYVLDIDSDNLGFCYRIYGAAFGRTPDEGGLRYWTGMLDNLDATNPGLNKEVYLAQQFLAADEFTALYGANSTDEEYIDAMYLNVLHRLPDDAGRGFWVASMHSGLGRDEILVSFSESIENRINADADYDDGVWVV